MGEGGDGIWWVEWWLGVGKGRSCARGERVWVRSVMGGGVCIGGLVGGWAAGWEWGWSIDDNYPNGTDPPVQTPLLYRTVS